MKICIIIPRFSVSGVPLAQMRMAKALSRRGHDIDFVVGFVDPIYQLPEIPGVNVVKFNCKKVSGMVLPLAKYFLTAKPDVIFSAEDHLNSVVLLTAIATGVKAKISCSSRVTPFDTYSNVPFSKRWILKQLMRLVMWKADALTCVSEGTVEEYQKVFSSSRHVCVYNIVDDPESRAKKSEPVTHEWVTNEDGPLLVAAGALEPWKGYSDLLKAIKSISNRRHVRLILLGDGSLRPTLEKMVTDLGLSEVVSLEGYVSNPLKYYTNADVFVHSAYVESLGNVLVEAMLCGCTPVSTDCPTGPREVLQYGKFGYLVPVGDPEALALGIEKALDKPISKNLLAEAVCRFEESTVLTKHFKLLGIDTKLLEI